MIKVAIDSDTSRAGDQGRGIGFHTKLLIEHLKKLKNLEIELVDTKTADLSKFDIVHYPVFDTHLPHLPSSFSRKTIVTVHDVVKLIYPKEYPLGIKGKLRFLQQKRRLQKADCIITISETSKKDIVRLLNIPAEKIHVIYLAPQHSRKASDKIKLGLPKSFVLYIGGVNYNKNLLNLAAACKLAKIKLVMVGRETVSMDFDKSNIETKSWQEFLDKYKNDPNIIRLGYVDEDKLACIWKAASIYCQPSLYEGFGLPILEAFEHETAVVAARTQALVEIGVNACVYFDPNDINDMAEKIQKLLKSKDLQNKLIKNGSQRLKNFSWNKAAIQTYEVYKTLL